MDTTPNRSRLFAASCMALIVTAMSFAIRGDIMGDLATQFELTKANLGWIAGSAFWGYTVAMVIGGPLCDFVGMKRLAWLAFLGHGVGIAVTIFATGYDTLFAGMLCIGIANGLVEAAYNPLIATIYPDNKTHKLNQFHVWFPGGIVIGGLIAFGIAQFYQGEHAWQIKMATMIPPMLVYGWLLLGQTFPVTERVASGVSTGAMFKACLSPIFIVMILAMFLTAATELGPNQWIPNILTFSAGVSGILVLVWISGLMAIGRQFSGPVVRALSPSGMLLGSAIFSAIGLFALSQAEGAVATFAAAGFFAIGVCYFWPTMLGVVAERMPKTGALGLSLMGGAGMLAVSVVLPIMGGTFDAKIDAAIPEGYTLEQISAPEAAPELVTIWEEVQAEGGAATLAMVAVVPLILIVFFSVMFFSDRSKGGYKPEKLSTDTPDDPLAPE